MEFPTPWHPRTLHVESTSNETTRPLVVLNMLPAFSHFIGYFYKNTMDL